MAAKVFFLLALTAVVVCAENDCTCDPKNDIYDKDLWNFLAKLSTDSNNPKDKEMNAVLPGVLSPLLDCKCLENSRRKRRILKETEKTSEQLDSQYSEDEEEPRNVVHFKSSRCSQGYVWIGIKCVAVEVLKRKPLE